MESVFDALSAKQKECLRLVAEGYTSKEIAPRVGLTYESVNTYVKTATRLLGAPNRAVAARMLLDFEAIPKLEFPSPSIAAAADSGETEMPDGGQGSLHQAPRNIGAWLSPPPLGGGSADLTVGEKMAAMLRAALFLAAVVATLLLLIVGGLKLL